MKKQKPPLKKTSHRVAATKPAIQRRIDVLKQKWNKLSHLDRGQRMLLLKSMGCSLRGLAAELKVPSTTLRRYIHLAELPPEERAKLKEGETERKALQRKAKRDRERESKERLEEEKRSGIPSSDVAEIILDFFRGRDGVPEDTPWVGQIPSILNEVKTITRKEAAARPVTFQLPINVSLSDLYAKARPQPYPDEFWAAHRAGWLSNILMVIAPDLNIRESAIAKAEERAHQNVEGNVIALDVREVDLRWARVHGSLRTGGSHRAPGAPLTPPRLQLPPLRSGGLKRRS